MRKVHALMTLAAAAALSCSQPDDVPCQPGYGLCGAVCVRIAADPGNCGACGNVCGAAEACVMGACVPDCGARLHGAITDPWGHAWDGIERPAAAYAAARDACAAIGGRLPTASELYRVSAVSTASVGDTYETNPLWSITPDDNASSHRVTLSSGAIAVIANGTPSHYRCVCPPPRPAAFLGGACYASEPGEACAPLGGDARFNFDRDDRPRVSKSGAIYECALAGGDLPTAERLAAAFSQGLPHDASTTALHTADTINAAGNNGTLTHGTPVTFGNDAATTLLPFRCYGRAAPGAIAASVENGFREPDGERVADLDPQPVATTYTQAVVDCFARGGHLPTGTELAAFAIQGLPAGGVTTARWTSDQADSTNVEVFAWSGTARWPIDPDLVTTTPTLDGIAYDGATSTRVSKTATASLPRHQCVYYAVDPGYPAPSCNGGCDEVAVGGRARMWFDRTNRGTTTATYGSAVADCADEGGRLASARDLVEAMAAGVYGPGGSSLVTSDLSGTALARLVSWTGYSFQNDVSSATLGTATAFGSSPYVYRCTWTNEIR
jgi:hypothetical protein